MKSRIIRKKSIEKLGILLAKNLLSYSKKMLKLKGSFLLVLSGGETPNILYKEILKKFKDDFLWEKIHLFFGDERFVDNNSPLSNFNSAYNNFIKHINIPEENIHKIRTDFPSVEKAADDYQEHLTNFFVNNNYIKSKTDIPVFDMILLGVGTDGHTASLFPGSLLLSENKKLVAPASPPFTVKPTVSRITFTLPLINNAKQVIFFVSKNGKEKIINDILKHNETTLYPAELVKAKEELAWYIERG